MNKATPLEMSGLVNWDRASEFQKMTSDEFKLVPEHQRCGAWRMINDSNLAWSNLFSPQDRFGIPGPDNGAC